MPASTETECKALDAIEVDAVRAVARLARFAERALGELSLAHYRVLSAIAAGDERASRVAAKFSLGKPTVSGTVDALHRSGLISKAAEAGDQRVSALALTDDGNRVLQQAELDLVVALRELGNHADDAGRLIEMLAGLGSALEAEAQMRNAASRRDRAGRAGRARGH